MKKNKLIVIDGNSLLFRAYFATAFPGAPIMRTTTGFPTNAIFAFSNMITKIINEQKDEFHLFVSFDTGKKTFRHEELETYKANRKPTPQELIDQMPVARELLQKMGVFIYEKDGLEGDDLAGTIAKEGSNKGYEVLVYTSDKDFLQLIDDNITVKLIKKGLSDVVDMNEQSMFEKYTFGPEQIKDYKGLLGDPSDNLPGIPGIGEKTAIKLINEYGSLESIIEHANDIGGKMGEKIIQGKDLGLLCKHLAEIVTNVELPFKVEDTLYKGIHFDELSSFCKKYELKQLMTKLRSQQQNTILKNNHQETNTNHALEIVVVNSFKNIALAKEIGIALDYDYTNYHRCEIYGIAIYSNSIAYYIKKDNLINDDYLLDILCSNEIAKDCYDYKAIKCALYSIGIQIEGLYNDILLGCYLLDSSLTNDIDTAFSLLGTILSKYEENNLLMQGNIKRTCEIAANSFMLINQLTSELEQNNYLSLYKDIEIPLCSVLADMENEGFPLDVDTLNEIGKTFQAKLNNATEQIYKVIGKEFNISSPKQVAEILFDELQLPDNAKRSTSIEVLNNLKDGHPVIPFLITYRKYQKLMSTYITGIQAYIHKDGKLHPTFNQALTTTGRLSSSEPNLQNISVRDEEAKLIRKSFFYKEDNISILSLDYSQIELRLLASMSKCDNLINIFNNDEDIHAATARNVFHVTEPTIPNDLRRKAKAVNFGIVYGISTWGLAEQIHCSPKEAADIIDSFYQTYPEIAVYLNDCKNKVQDNGYVTTLFGRKRFIREIFDSNYSTREFAKRAAMNAPIQGTAADLIKIAMIKVANHIKDLHLKSRLVLQIHDELILKVYDDEKDIIMKIVKEDMENAYKLQVKLTVDGGFGKTWYDAK